MFNLNKSNRIVMAQHPVSMRMEVNHLIGQVSLNPANGEVYIFVGISGSADISGAYVKTILSVLLNSCEYLT